MGDFVQFGFGQGDNNIGSVKEKYKGESGRKDRISLAFIPMRDGKPDFTAPTPTFVGAQRSYIEGVGYFLNKGPEYTKLAGGQPPRMAVATVVIQWPTDRQGKVSAERLKGGEAKVLPWIFSEDKYSQLATIHDQFPLLVRDVLVNCTDTKFQKMTFTPCSDGLFHKLVTESFDNPLVQDLLAKIAMVSADLQSEVARDMTLDQIREKMTGAPAGSGPVAASAAAESTAAIDAAVGNILDG